MKNVKNLLRARLVKKRIVEVEYPDKEEILDAYNIKLSIKPWVMFVDKHENGKIESGLYREIYDENNVHYGGGLTITHCTFCGEKFAI